MSNNLSQEAFGGALDAEQVTTLETTIRNNKRVGLAGFWAAGVEAITEKKKRPHGEFEKYVLSRNKAFEDTDGMEGFEEDISTLENWMRLVWLDENYPELYQSLKHRSATYIWVYARKLKAHLRNGDAPETFTYSPVSHSRGKRIEHALSELDSIGLEEFGTALIEEATNTLIDFYNQDSESFNVSGEDAPVTRDAAIASVIEGVQERLQRMLDNKRNNSQWNEPISEVVAFRDMLSGFESVADEVVKANLSQDHQVRISIFIKKDKRHAKPKTG